MVKKNRSQGNDINRPRSRQTQNTEYKKVFKYMLLSKQHLSNIWGSIHEKAKQHWVWI